MGQEAPSGQGESTEHVQTMKNWQELLEDSAFFF